ncbi:DeoR/GlpR family DNA-binding transcription regulator [Lysinibacter cavernae]|uniref:DeoR family fructose operon transcriptional repressor n=1 Tax=Lysinibacter cavernae TaxID=1640652 RepID=A0A7X5R1L0_9MICO|nr:DeoR/GlpR family DNA-binding transcription regulator [Lysinibacter cavernae]NIH54029.1 DeoR family fructose operon transcriptional repressor [Lysinibacter cavernae]
MATTRSIDAETRRAALLDILRSNGDIRLEAAAESLGVSTMTVRRDLDELDAEGMLRRVRGGAIPALDARPFHERRITRSAAKQRIADKVSAFLPSSGAIALDASSTAGALVERFAPDSSLIVATNSYENFVSLSQNKAVSPVLTGGELDARTGSFVGPIACQTAASMLYSHFFTSSSAVDPTHGTSEASLTESQVKRAFADQAQEIIVLVDSSKLGQQSISMGFALADISMLVTELEPSDPLLDPYREFVALL